MRIPEINENLNGTISQGEIIADNGGLKESFMVAFYFLNFHLRNKDILGSRKRI